MTLVATGALPGFLAAALAPAVRDDGHLAAAWALCGAFTLMAAVMVTAVRRHGYGS